MDTGVGLNEGLHKSCVMQRQMLIQLFISYWLILMVRISDISVNLRSYFQNTNGDVDMLILENHKCGPSNRFVDSDVILLLDKLSQNEHMSRVSIKDFLNLGEGSARKLVDLLKEYHMVDVKQTGVSIKAGGNVLLNSLGLNIVDIQIPYYVIGKFQQGVLVKNAMERVFNGIEQRNTAIRAGGDGCTTWVMRDGFLIMLPDWNVDKENPQLSANIRRSVNMDDGDVFIVGGGETLRLARAAAIDAALGLI